MKKSVMAALGGVMTALSLLLLQLGAVVWLLAYIMPLLCGILMIAVYHSAGGKTVLLIYAAVSILSLILLNDKECALLYVLFFGYYPLLREKLTAVGNRILRFLIKLAVFNAGVVAAELLCVYVFGIPFDLFLGKWSALVLLLCANLVFVIYERLLSMLTVIYVKKYKPRLDKYFK